MAEIEKYVVQNLPIATLDYLTAFCEEYRIVVPDDRRENRDSLVKVAIRHLSSVEVENSADGGAALFVKTHGELQGEGNVVKTEPPMPNLGNVRHDLLSGHENIAAVDGNQNLNQVQQPNFQAVPEEHQLTPPPVVGFLVFQHPMVSEHPPRTHQRRQYLLRCIFKNLRTYKING